MIVYYIAYLGLLKKARKHKKGIWCHYSYWIWAYLALFLLCRKMGFKTLEKYAPAWFIFQNVWGLCFGTQIFWAYDRYRILYQLGNRKKEKDFNKLYIHMGDLFIHVLPLLILFYVINKKDIVSPQFSSILTFIQHISYCYFIRGDLNCGKLYMIETDTKTSVMGWSIFLLSYISSELVMI